MGCCSSSSAAYKEPGVVAASAPDGEKGACPRSATTSPASPGSPGSPASPADGRSGTAGGATGSRARTPAASTPTSPAAPTSPADVRSAAAASKQPSTAGAGSEQDVASPSAASGAEPPGQLAYGAVVLVRGLVATPWLNGEEGTCQQFDTNTGRWHVRLRGGTIKAFKPENLLEVAPDSPQRLAPSSEEPQVEPGEPPLLETATAPSQRAKAAMRLLEGGGRSPFGAIDADDDANPRQLPRLKVTLPDDLDSEEGMMPRLLQPQNLQGALSSVQTADDEFLGEVDDERIVLEDLDADLQLYTVDSRFGSGG